MGEYMDQQVPETIDQRYEVGAVIGSGAMATVYEAVDTRLGRKVALFSARQRPSRHSTTALSWGSTTPAPLIFR